MHKSYNVGLSVPQSDFYVSRAPSLAVIAGFGSGKTFTLWMKLWSWLCDYPGVMHGYFAPTHGLIRDILYPLVESWCEAAGVSYTILQNPGYIIIHGLGTIICRSMEVPSRIVGFEIGHAAIDEIDILTKLKAWQAWRAIKARCRIKLFDKDGNAQPNQLALASTPEGFKMAYEAFEKDRLPGSQLIQMSTYSNAHNLPEGYIEELKANYPDNLINAYIYGRFTNLTSGTVYTEFDRHFNGCRNIRLGRGERLYVGMDFNVRKMAAIVHVKRPPFVVAYKEHLGIQDTPTMIEVLQEAYGSHPITIYPDASGNNNSSLSASLSDIEMLYQAGFNVAVGTTQPAVKDRINSMNMAFTGTKGYKYVVDLDNCPIYVETLEQQAYNGYGKPDKDKDQDHPNDAAGYFIEMDYGITRPVHDVAVRFIN